MTNRKKPDGRPVPWLTQTFLTSTLNETWQETISHCPLPSQCFSGRSEEQDSRPASDCLRRFRLLLWIKWTILNETSQEARTQEKKEEIWLSPMTKAHTPTEMSKGQSDNSNNVTKKFDYTAVADRLRTVSWSNFSHPTCVVNLVYGHTPCNSRVIKSTHF